jgi:hypothetical protein
MESAKWNGNSMIAVMPGLFGMIFDVDPRRDAIGRSKSEDRAVIL